MPPEHVEIVMRLFDAFNNRDGSRTRELWTDDAEWRPAYFGGGLVEGAVYRGTEEIERFIAVQAETWERLSATPVDTRVVGDRVLTEVRVEAVGRASGLTVKETTWNVFEVRDGRVAAGRSYTDRAEALAAVGLTE